MTEPFHVNRAGGPHSPPPSGRKASGPAGSSFADTLRQARETEGAATAGAPAAGAGLPAVQPGLVLGSDLRFSNHAQKRMQSREISLTDEGLARLSTAVDKAEKRGGKESLVLMDELAFIVNIRERLVVTALDASQRGEGVFTQIDSVVIAGAQ